MAVPVAPAAKRVTAVAAAVVAAALIDSSHPGSIAPININNDWVWEALVSCRHAHSIVMHCKPSTSPKLDKSNMEGDDEPFHDAALYRTVTCKLIYPAKRRGDIQSTVRWLCKRLRNPDVKAGRQLTKLLRYLQGTKHLANYFPKEGAVDKIEGFCDGDWAGDEIDRKSVSGAAVVVGQCCLHSHSREARTQSLSSGKQEIVSISEILKDLLLIQFNLEFVGFGRLPIVIYTDASVARQFVHRKGVGRMKHLEVRYLWLQDQLAKGAYTCRKIPCSENPSDMLTHPRNAAEVVQFREKLGMYPMECSV